MKTTFLAIGLFALGCGSSGSSDSEPTPPADAGSDVAIEAAGGEAGAGGLAGGAGVGGSAGASMEGGAGRGGSCNAPPLAKSVVDPALTASLSISNDPPAARGIFDPDLVYPAAAPAGAMSYSAVVSTHEITTRIAVSADAGATWTHVATANVSEAKTIDVVPTSTRCPGGKCSGHWVHEVSALAFDPDDPEPGRRWKLYTHSYLVLPNDQLAYDLGHIALHVAPDPLGPWSTEGPALGWNSESKISSDGAALNVSTYSQVKDCLLLTEPAVLVRGGGTIDVAVGCGKVDSIRIELFRSLDHGKSYLYAGQLLGAEDGLCLGGDTPRVNAADLFVAGGKPYLIVSPQAPTLVGIPGYRGCAVMPLTLSGEGVQRDAEGRPVVTRFLGGPNEQFFGACTAAEGASAAGYMVSMLPDATFPPVFKIYSSGVPSP